MNYELFWMAFGAIGGTVGAIATSAAVIVALWQTKYANKKKIKVEFCDCVRLAPRSDNPAKRVEYVGVTVTNLGNRNIKLVSWGFRFPNDKYEIIPRDTFTMRTAQTLPGLLKLEPEDQTSQYWDKDLFYAYILDKIIKYNKRDRRKKICWIVKDSTGRSYKVMTKKTLQEYFDEATEWRNKNL